MKSFKQVACSALLAVTTGLAACGGGSGGGQLAGIGGTGKIASGSITKFGSIFVNGVEYDISNAACSVNDSDATGNCQANLSLGMVVTVEGTVSGTSGSAQRVVFDANVEGPVSGVATDPDGLSKSFSVLGVGVRVDKATTVFESDAGGFGFATLADNNVVEVSGFFDAGGTLQATFIELKASAASFGTTAVELKGSATGVTGNGGPGDGFTLNGVTVTLLPGVDLSDLPGNRVNNGDIVEARGILTGAASMDASRVQPEDTSLGSDGDELSVEGLVSNFSGDLSDFRVAGQAVNASGASLTPTGLQLSNGLKVEVGGTLSGNILVADEIETRSDEIKIDAPLSSVTANSVTVLLGDGTITVNVNNQTKISDATNAVKNPGLSDFSSGQFVQIRGFKDATGVVATEIQRDVPDNVILQGPVDGFASGTSVTILGVTFFTDAGTQFEDRNENSIGSGAFYGALSAGDRVKVRDDQPDGTADEVDRES